MFTPQEVARILDTEGCICSTVATTHPSPCVKLGMTTVEYPRLMQEQFGGGLYFTKRDRVKYPNWSDTWQWSINGKACEPILLQTLPYLKLKKVQAEAALLMLSTLVGKSKRMTDKQLLLRWTLHELLHKLNKRGPAVNDVIEQLEAAEF